MPFNWPEFDNDDPGFLICATELVSGFVQSMNVPNYQVFRIDNWFGQKWLGFCGKKLGAFGVANYGKVVVPPFVQNRLTAQSLFVRIEAGSFEYQGTGPQIHHIGASGENFKHFARDVTPEKTLFWISGNTRPNQRGSLMAYHPGPGNYWLFYVEYQLKNGEWSISQQRQMPPKIAEQFRMTAVSHTERC